MTRLIVVLFALVALIGLAPAAPVPKHLMPKDTSLNFPTAVGTKWVYDNNGSESTQVISRSEKKSEGTLVTADWSAPKNNYRSQTVYMVTPKGVYFHQESGQTYDPPLLYFKFHARTGETWDSTITLSGSEIRIKKTGGPVETIKVPAGEFRTVRVDGEMDFGAGTKRKTAQWFADGIGMVKVEGCFELKSFTLGKD